ncbi:hypothetical protein EYF80_011474 [Liparis tanakae]|uniref:Uncharacterized protein n=1 Tax=Liparis tanakae TaxID=230148 RepID=A0A4Z2IL91_9TELE|nr:hypothetical protein EYF80_011474 [Liparis tanakae]
MDRSLRRAGALQRDLKVLNQKEERDLQHRLTALDRQYRYTLKRLQQRRDSLVAELSRVGMVKVVEPKATVNIAMREIGERTFQIPGGRRSHSSKSQYHDGGLEPAAASRSISAPAAQPAGSVRRRGRVQSSVSLMQMKDIATIDSISEKELARRQRREREDRERLRQIQREALCNRVAAFIESLREKRDMDKCTLMELLEHEQQKREVRHLNELQLLLATGEGVEMLAEGVQKSPDLRLHAALLRQVAQRNERGNVVATDPHRRLQVQLQVRFRFSLQLVHATQLLGLSLTASCLNFQQTEVTQNTCRGNTYSR